MNFYMNLEHDTIPGVSHEEGTAAKLRNHGFRVPVHGGFFSFLHQKLLFMRKYCKFQSKIKHSTPTNLDLDVSL